MGIGSFQEGKVINRLPGATGEPGRPRAGQGDIPITPRPRCHWIVCSFSLEPSLSFRHPYFFLIVCDVPSTAELSQVAYDLVPWGPLSGRNYSQLREISHPTDEPFYSDFRLKSMKEEG